MLINDKFKLIKNNVKLFFIYLKDYFDKKDEFFVLLCVEIV